MLSASWLYCIVAQTHFLVFMFTLHTHHTLKVSIHWVIFVSFCFPAVFEIGLTLPRLVLHCNWKFSLNITAGVYLHAPLCAPQLWLDCFLFAMTIPDFTALLWIIYDPCILYPLKGRTMKIWLLHSVIKSYKHIEHAINKEFLNEWIFACLCFAVFSLLAFHDMQILPNPTVLLSPGPVWDVSNVILYSPACPGSWASISLFVKSNISLNN